MRGIKQDLFLSPSELEEKVYTRREIDLKKLVIPYKDSGYRVSGKGVYHFELELPNQDTIEDFKDKWMSYREQVTYVPYFNKENELVKRDEKFTLYIGEAKSGLRGRINAHLFSQGIQEKTYCLRWNGFEGIYPQYKNAISVSYYSFGGKQTDILGPHIDILEGKIKLEHRPLLGDSREKK